jgi:hypothetical protein
MFVGIRAPGIIGRFGSGLLRLSRGGRPFLGSVVAERLFEVHQERFE